MHCVGIWRWQSGCSPRFKSKITIHNSSIIKLPISLHCWDNAALESFFKTLKVERVHRTRYETRAQAKLDIVDWIEGFYNRQRIHSSIGYNTPVGAESRLMSA